MIGEIMNIWLIQSKTLQCLAHHMILDTRKKLTFDFFQPVQLPLLHGPFHRITIIFAIDMTRLGVSRYLVGTINLP
jgi:hypothetical protein